MNTPEVVEGILTHHGVKGMRWGVRRKATVGPQVVVVSDKRKKLKTSGGQGHPAHPDAVRVRTLGQIGKKSGLKALSDDELRAYTNRLNLEASVHRLNYQEKPAAKKFVSSLLRQQGSVAVNDVANAQIKKHVTRRFAAGAVKAAVA